MKKILILTLVAILASSCSALQPGQNPAPAPDIDTLATIDAIVRESSEETLAAQPSPTAVPVIDTATSVVASSPTTEAASDAPSSTPAPNLTTTPATATSGPTQANATATATLASGKPTLTPTLGILKYGTLPPAVPSAKVTILNKSKAQAYISLQNRPPDREVAILEYPVEKQVKVDAPLGYYLYVVWVGGRKIVGEFTLMKDDEITITIYKDRVEISN